DADAADFAGSEGVVRVVTHLRRQIESDAQAADALREQVPVSPVGFLRRREPRVLPHRPEPAAVHGWLDAASKGKLARIRKLLTWIPVRHVGGREDRREVHGGDCTASFEAEVAVSA